MYYFIDLLSISSILALFQMVLCNKRIDKEPLDIHGDSLLEMSVPVKPCCFS